MKRIGIIFITIISFLLILCTGLYFFGVFYFRHWFCPNTYINGINVSNRNYEVCDKIINDLVVNHNLIIEDEDGTQIFIDGNEIYKYNMDEVGKAIQYIKDSQNPYLWVKCFFVKQEYVYYPQRYLNEDKLNEIIDESVLGQKDRYDATRRAEIVYTKEGGYELRDDTKDLLDWDMFEEVLKDASVNDKGYINLAEAGVYKSIEEDAQAKALHTKWNKIEKTIDFNMTYKLATGEDIVVDSSVVSNFLALDENNEIVFNEKGEAELDSKKILDYVQSLSDEYDNM